MAYNFGMNRARICVPVCARTADEMMAGAAGASDAADFVELRFDCLDPTELDKALRGLAALLETSACPLVITFRAAGQGGHATGPAEDVETRRGEFWRRVREMLEACGRRSVEDISSTSSTKTRSLPPCSGTSRKAAR
jgi:hypothetical protein